MHCRNCFHNDICGDSSPYNDASMCKQYIERSNVLYGSALKVVLEDYERLQDKARRLERTLKNSEIRQVGLEKEVELLRIIKQTLEMQSGMKFDF